MAFQLLPQPKRASNFSRRQFIYVIGADDGRWKIGVSHQPKSRLRELQTGHPGLLRIAFVANSNHKRPSAVEAFAHNLLRDCRRVGEWFQCELHEAIAAVERARIAADDGTSKRYRTQPRKVSLREMQAVSEAMWIERETWGRR
jgi:hypothetical protein